jgi:hypothetical protein
VADPNAAAAAGAMIPTPPFVFRAKSHQRLIHAAKLVWHYDAVARNTAAGDLQWTLVMKNFSEQWKALEDKKGYNKPQAPKTTTRHSLLSSGRKPSGTTYIKQLEFAPSLWPASLDLRWLCL